MDWGKGEMSRPFSGGTRAGALVTTLIAGKVGEGGGVRVILFSLFFQNVVDGLAGGVRQAAASVAVVIKSPAWDLS